VTSPRTERFRVWTSHGSGSYRTRSKAIAAAQWTAGETGETVVVANEASGHRWDVSPAGRVHDAWT
jgi:hypothetical protein